MKNEYLNSEEAQQIIVALSEKIAPLLVEGRTYHFEALKTAYGSSRGRIYFYENGIRHSSYYSEKYTPEEIIAHIIPIDACNLFKLSDFFPEHSKIKYTFKKGELINVEKYTIPMLLESIKENTISTLRKLSDCDDLASSYKAEALFHFKKEADEIGMFTDATYYYDDQISSFDHFGQKEDILSIYHQLEEKIERLYFIYENDTIKAKTDPAFETYGLEPLTIAQIELDPDYKKRKEASEECKKQRHAFFNSLGKLEDRIIYLRVDDSNHSWPGSSSTHNSCTMRVIYAPESTILITDGLSDIYSNPDEDGDLEYNGIGAELYMEFHGAIPYEVIHEHFAVALINRTSQMAIGQGNFKPLMEDHGEAPIQFSEKSVELWVNKENNANQDLSSFLTPKDFIEEDGFVVLLGVASQTVPQKLQLNLEEILLVSIKPVSKKWQTATHLRNPDREAAKESIQSIVKEFKDKGEWNLVPLTYQDEYRKNDADLSMTLTPIFPF